MIRFATIGTSRITEKFLAAAAFCSDFHLEAVYSRDLERAKAFASAHGAEKCYGVEQSGSGDNVSGCTGTSGIADGGDASIILSGISVDSRKLT